MLVFDHVEGTLLGRLGAAREPIEVQLDRTCRKVHPLVLRSKETGPKHDQPRLSPHPGSHRRRSGRHPTPAA